MFVFGLPRSGTTLVEQVLASHSQVYGAGELRLGPAVVRGDSRRPRPLGGAARMRAVSRPRGGEQAGRDASRAARCDRRRRSGRVVDKMPDNYMYIGLLAVMFPGATFIHCRRDLRDIAVSCWMTDFRSIRWSNDQDNIAARFRQYRRLMNHWKEVLPVAVLEVNYEDTVTDLEATARRLIDACGLSWEPACLEFHRTERPIRTASVMQVRQPVYQRSVARWKNYEAVLGELFAGLPKDDDTGSA